MNPLMLIGGICLMLGLVQMARENEEGDVPILPKPKKKKKAKPAPVSVVVQSPSPSVVPVEKKPAVVATEVLPETPTKE